MYCASGTALAQLCGLETAQGSGPRTEADLHGGDGRGSRATTRRVWPEVGREVSHDCEVLAQQLDPGDPVLRASAGDSEDYLHDQRHRVAEHVAAQSDQSTRLISQRRGGEQTALSGITQHREEVDHASPRLEGCAQPLRHHLRGAAAGELSRKPIDECTSKAKNRAMETVEKQTAFSHRSHSPYCC